MDVSIIIVNYNTKALTKQCLQSVFEKTKEIAFEVIVVDNASHDGSQQMLKEEFIDIRLVECMENIGFGRANNEGIKRAKGRNIFLLNPDTQLLNNAVKILSDYLDNNENVGVCGGNLYDENNKPVLSFGEIPCLWSEIKSLFGHIPYKLNKNYQFNFSNKPLEVGYITGADMMIKKTIFDKAGWFDTDFFMYYEETELTWRMRKLGYQIVNVPQAEIIHLEGKSLTCNFDRLKKILLSRSLFYKKTHSKLYRYFADAIFYFAAITRLVIFKLLGNQNKVNIWLFTLKNIR